MLLCLNDSNCLTHGRCVSGLCLCPYNYRINQNTEVRSIALIPPLVGALRQEILPLRHIYLAIIVVLISIGFINNLFAFVVFLRPLIRLTVSGIYSVVLSITGFLLMLLLLTNIPTAWFYDRPGFRLWACYTYPYLHLILINFGLLMTAAIATEGVLTKCFGFRRFRTRKYALFTVSILLAVVTISNLDKIVARQLDSNGLGASLLYLQIQQRFSVDLHAYIHVLRVHCTGLCSPCILLDSHSLENVPTEATMVSKNHLLSRHSVSLLLYSLLFTAVSNASLPTGFLSISIEVVLERSA